MPRIIAAMPAVFPAATAALHAAAAWSMYPFVGAGALAAFC
jgi:hypothetical protein